jgi:large subunit ribosomal protein L35
MPKVKPHKGVGKRVKVSARGKVMRRKSFARHRMSHKPGKRCRHLRKWVPVSPRYQRRLLHELGEG